MRQLYRIFFQGEQTVRVQNKNKLQDNLSSHPIDWLTNRQTNKERDYPSTWKS